MSESQATPPSLVELFRVFGRIGLINFGGPAGQIALMHRVLVEEKRWIDEPGYLRALNFCMLLPGPEAQQLAAYVGWRLHGVKGGLIAGLLFIGPGVLVVLALSLLYASAAHLGPVSAALLGVKAAVLAIVVEALLRVARRALETPAKRAIAAAAFVSLFVFQAPFPAVVLAAALAGLLLAHFWPGTLGRSAQAAPESAPRSPARAMILPLARTIATWGAIWMAPLAAAVLALGRGHVLVQLGLFFSKLALVTFGGAYAVLSYMAQEAVVGHGWLRPGEMVDGLGLAETTPGPLILVTEFVGFLTAFRTPAPFAPLVAGLMGAGMAIWMTFAPCFLWIFAGAPFVERLEHARRIRGALAAITAAVVGVIGNLAVWFGLHVLFGRFMAPGAWGLSVGLPDLTSLDGRAAALSAVAAALLFGLRAGVLWTLAACVGLGLALHVLLLA